MATLHSQILLLRMLLRCQPAANPSIAMGCLCCFAISRPTWWWFHSAGRLFTSGLWPLQRPYSSTCLPAVQLPAGLPACLPACLLERTPAAEYYYPVERNSYENPIITNVFALKFMANFTISVRCGRVPVAAVPG